MTIEPSEYLTRHTLLAFLSDEENARVANVEGEPRLADGEEYVDLGHLTHGVRRMSPQTNVSAGQVLPRFAVKEKTWARICARLGVTVTARR